MAEGSRSPLGRVAWGISYAINPLILPPLLFGWLGQSLGLPAQTTWAYVALTGVFLGILPLAVVGFMVWRGRARSLEVRDRTKRFTAFLWAIGFGVAAVLVALVVFPDTMAASLLAIFPVNSALLAAINQRTKISVHSASIAGLASMSLWFSLVAALPLNLPIVALACTPIVMWARVRAKAHTVGQVLLGAAFGTVVPTLELYLLAGTGWLGIVA